MKSFIAYLQLMRPANIITAMADILAGFSASSLLIFNHPTELIVPSHPFTALAWLLLATIGLYGGGIVFNDVFDAKVDSKERPKRPIPSGLVSQHHAATLGIGLFIFGLSAAYQVSSVSFSLAVSICLLCFSYNAYTKHTSWLGPINMGLCRSGNLLLGASAISDVFNMLWSLAIIHFVFIAAVTTISKNEVAGGHKSALWSAVVLYLLTIGVTTLTLFQAKGLHVFCALPFLLLFAYQVLTPLGKAIKNPSPIFIQQAVKAGVISLIILDAAITAGFTSFMYGALVMMLLPISILLARNFSVT